MHAASDTALALQYCPITVHPVWKPQADKLGLLLQYRRNPSFESSGPVTLSNLVFIATYEGARASGVQTKPSGTHLKDKHLVYWRLGDVTLTEEWGKIICRVIGEQNAEPVPGHIEVRWEWAAPVDSGISVERLVGEGVVDKGKGKAVEEDPFADSGTPGSWPASPNPEVEMEQARRWVDVPLVRKLVNGKYEAR